MTHPIPILLALLACSESPVPKSADVKTPAPVAATAAAPAAPAGPDGPESIQVPVIAAISTDAAVIAEGEKVFGARGCGACHQFETKVVGPALSGVLTRRSTTWVERMVADPEIMTKQDPVAKDLFRASMVQMTKQGVTAEEMPKLIAYIKAKGG